MVIAGEGLGLCETPSMTMGPAAKFRQLQSRDGKASKTGTSTFCGLKALIA